MSNIPQSGGIKEKIKSLVESNIENTEVKKIILLHKLDKYREGVDLLDKSVKDWKKLLKEKEKKTDELMARIQAIDNSWRNIDGLKQEMQEKEEEYFSGKAIVVLKHKHMKE